MSSVTEQRKCPICGKPQDEAFRPFCTNAAPISISAAGSAAAMPFPVVEDDEALGDSGDGEGVDDTA